MKTIASLVLLIAATIVVRSDPLILHGDSEEEELHKISTCMAECLKTFSRMEECYGQCTEPGALDRIEFRYPEKVFKLELVCRDSTSLLVDVRGETAEDSINIYVVKIDDGVDKLYFMSNQSLVRLEHLVPNQQFKISATVLSSNSEFVTSKPRTFKTLALNFTPGQIRDLRLEEFISNPTNKSLLDAVISWTPANDRSCHHELLFYANQLPDSELKQLSFELSTSLHHYTIPSLLLNTEYDFSVRSVNPRDLSLQKKLHWTTFYTPSCSEWFNSSASCSPEAPTNIHVIAKPIATDLYQVNISWDQPELTPDHYTIKLLDLDPANQDGSVNSLELNVTGSATSVLIDSFAILGPQIEVLIIAYANHFASPPQSVIRPVHATQPAALGTWPPNWIAVVILAAVFFLLSGITSLIKQREKYPLPDAESPCSISLNSTIQVILPLVAFEDEMEIEFNRIKLLEVLGEGAFGVVRKGQLDQTQVAVKMLKEHASPQSVKEFRHEIEVMKSVGSHPNVVGIVGHFTKRAQDMMLLTEYCSKGNLLNYLRGEWAKILQSKKKIVSEYLDCQTPCLNGDKQPENVFNFDTSFVNEKSSIGYKNICGPAFENRLYPILAAINDANNNSKQLNAVQNQCYMDAITCDHLVDFARQIATGMDFLARNKVVHRDLAARNVLLSSNHTAKIADFGLSRDIYQENLYRKKGSDKLPIKWLALESLTHQIYTVQSDVWSFGVLLYEICTLGGNPYPHLTAKNLIAELKQGYRMERPAGCSEELYELMASCWKIVPVERPNFSGILERLEQLRDGKVALVDVDAIVELHVLSTVVSEDRSYLKPVEEEEE